MNKIKRYGAKILLCLLTAISIYVIVYVGLGYGWSIGESENYERINKVLESLSYSYLAGCIFYLLTTYYSYWGRKQQLRPVMKYKMHKIVQMIDDVILEFSRDVDTSTKTASEDLKIILDSKSWTDDIPMLKLIQGISVSYISYLAIVGKNVRTNVMELIQLYKEYLSEEQITRLEGLVEMQAFRSAMHFSSYVNMNLDNPDGKKFLIDEFIKMYEELKSIEKTFA